MTHALLREYIQLTLSEAGEQEPHKARFLEGLRRLAAQNGGSIPVTHETSYENGLQIIEDQEISGDPGSIFATLGYLDHSSFVPGPGMRFLINIPIKYVHTFGPDMVYVGDTDDDGYRMLLDSFPDLEGAEVYTTLESLPSKWWYDVQDNETGESIPFD